MYTIILSDGTKLENLVLNGNTFIAEGVLEDAVFEGKLENVTIENEEGGQTYADMALLHCHVEDGKTWFVLGQKSEQQKKEEQREANITDVQMALTELYELMLGGM